MNIKKLLLLLSLTFLTACGGSGSDDTNKKNTQSASQTNLVNTSDFKKLEGVWKFSTQPPGYYVFDDKGNYKIIAYSKPLNCNILFDSYTVNNSGKIDFKKISKYISDVNLWSDEISITKKTEQALTTTHLYKTTKIEQDLGSFCKTDDPSGRSATMKDISGLWRRTVNKDGKIYEQFMHINNKFINTYITSDKVNCYLKSDEPIRLHEVGLGIFTNDIDGSISIKKGSGKSSITIQDNLKKSSPAVTWNKSYLNINNFNLCKE